VRIAFFGTSAFAAGALERLVREDGIEIAVVVSQPDRPAGRGRKTATPPAVIAARELGLPVVQEERASEAPPDVVAAAVIELVAELDAGPIHGLERFPISPGDDAGAVAGRALDLGVPLLAAALRGETSGHAQEGEPTYAHRIGADDRRIDWSRPAAAIADQVRALAPHIGARAQLDDLPVTVWRATAVAGDGAPGAITADGGAVRIAAGERALEVHELQPAGKRRMTAAEFLRGRQSPPARAT
jgi:methionyl-tRNA formyltransferase